MINLFPELEGLKGGKKQAWVSNHLDLIWSLNNELGFDKAREVLHMKADTLISALQRAEKSNRPAVTNGKRALAKAQYVESLAYDIEKRLRTLQGSFERQQQALAAGLDMIERVLLMLRLALTGEEPVKVSKADFERDPDKLYVM